MNQTNTTLGLYHFAFLDGRLASFKQLRALGHALAGCGLPLSAFMISLHGSSVRPVQSGEVRVPLGGGEIWHPHRGRNCARTEARFQL